MMFNRPTAHLMGLHLQIPRGAHANAEQSRQGSLQDHMISPSPFDQADADDGSPDVTALTGGANNGALLFQNARMGYREILQVRSFVCTFA